MKRLFKKMLTVISAGIIAATANLSAFATETVNYDDKFWMVEYLTGKKVIYSNDNYYVTEDGKLENYAWGGISMNYVLHLESEELTLEKLGLSAEEYTLHKGTTSLFDGTVEYYINVSTLEEADALYEKAQAVADTGVFINAYKRCSYSYGCNAGVWFNIKLKDAEASFDSSCIEECDGLEITKSSTDPTLYTISCKNGFAYKAVMEAKEFIEADENVESFDSELWFCAVAHTELEKEYIFEETIVPYYVFRTLAGDIDLSDDTGISDIVALTKYTTNPELYAIKSKNALGNADMNKDNSIDSIDTSILIEMMIGTYESAF